MRSLLIYINPKKDFDSTKNDRRLAEVQIDNSLTYFKPKDTLFVTNFPYEYHGVKTLEVPGELFCEIKPKASKINTIIYLIENNLLSGVSWFHDLDAFQQALINLKLEKDAGFTDYGTRKRWNTGSFFFTPQALNIFKLIKRVVERYRCNEEMALSILERKNTDDINSHYQKINISYNLGPEDFKEVLKTAEKPIKVVHSRPHPKDTFELMKPVLSPSFIRLIEERYYL